jgi:hypothetical protein
MKANYIIAGAAIGLLASIITHGLRLNSLDTRLKSLESCYSCDRASAASIAAASMGTQHVDWVAVWSRRPGQSWVQEAYQPIYQSTNYTNFHYIQQTNRLDHGG